MPAYCPSMIFNFPRNLASMTINKHFVGYSSSRQLATAQTQRDLDLKTQQPRTPAMSLIISHRERKKHKTHHNSRTITSFLLNPLKTLPSRHPKSDIVKTERPHLSNNLIDQTATAGAHLETRISETTRQSEKRKAVEESQPQLPTENPFFDVPACREVTDQQLYEEFKAAYVAKGIENALRRRRRGSKKNKASTK